MQEFLSLHDAEQIEAESAPVVKPGLANVFKGVIRDPMETFRQAFAHPIQSYAMTLAAAGGVYWAMNLAIAQAGGHTLSLPQMLAMIVALGIPGGIAYMFALTILLHWSCDILGGAPERRKIRMLLAYAGVPALVSLVCFGLPRLFLFGSSLFMPEREWMTGNPVLVWGLWFGDALCFAWSLMLVVKGLKLMNGFSTARAIGAALLPTIPMLLIGFVFLLIAGWGLFTAPAW